MAAQGRDSYCGGSYCGDGLIVYGFMTVKCKRAAEQTLEREKNASYTEAARFLWAWFVFGHAVDAFMVQKHARRSQQQNSGRKKVCGN